MTTTKHIRTRFAPSPTGFIHLGNIRSALYPWAFARSQKGDFILRIEDTDLERSSQEAIDVILESMDWLGLTPDEGPFYQMQRTERYQQVLKKLQEAEFVYPCYMSTQDLNALREQQLAAKQKPRYDGTWRPEKGKTLPAIPQDVKPVWRFKTPTDGSVVWNDKVKGRIEVANAELDDLIIARADGTPTYNFCVVVDDIDMNITHVIRGDDHVNNTPRQIHIFKALGKPIPEFAHLPTVLNNNGEKMSKRNGAKAVTEYRDEGYLADAVLNYLARLGWSHGDNEIFSRTQFLEWFNLNNLGKSPAQFDEDKLRWVNSQHIKMLDDETLAKLVVPFISKHQITENMLDERLPAICALFKDRCETLVQLASLIAPFYQDITPDAKLVKQHYNEEIEPAIKFLADLLRDEATWDKETINKAIKQTLTKFEIKMPKLAIPVRVLVMGTTQTPSLDTVLALQKKENVLQRLQKTPKLG